MPMPPPSWGWATHLPLMPIYKLTPLHRLLAFLACLYYRHGRPRWVEHVELKSATITWLYFAWETLFRELEIRCRPVTERHVTIVRMFGVFHNKMYHFIDFFSYFIGSTWYWKTITLSSNIPLCWCGSWFREHVHFHPESHFVDVVLILCREHL